MTASFLDIKQGRRLAYQKLDGIGMPIVFLAGHGSDMLGSKAEALFQDCQAKNRPFIRFDYSGHGQSEGVFLEGTISQWTEDAIAILEALTDGPVILVGSSLGGWIMLNLAKTLGSKIAGLIGIAAAPDFTETLIWNELDETQRQLMIEEGQIALPNPYADEDVIYPYHLVTDGRQNLLLTDRLDIACPIYLHQGMKDHEVPWQTAIDIANATASEDVTINLVKEAGHRFSTDAEIASILASVDVIYEKVSD